MANSDDPNQISLFLTSILKSWVEFGIIERADVFAWWEYYPIILTYHVNYPWRLPKHSTFFSIKVKYWTAVLTKRTELTFIEDKYQRRLDNIYFFQEHFWTFTRMWPLCSGPWNNSKATGITQETFSDYNAIKTEINHKTR